MSFLKGVFSESGEGSAGRVMTLLHFVLGGAWGTHVVLHSHAMLDPVTLTALGGFITLPYGLTASKSTLTNIFGNGKNGKAPTP